MDECGNDVETKGDNNKVKDGTAGQLNNKAVFEAMPERSGGNTRVRSCNDLW